MILTRRSATAFAALPLVVAGSAAGDCEPVDFDGFPIGTVATNIVPGVTFAAVPGSCGGSGSVLPIVVEATAGTSSGNQALSLETGCPDFSPDFLSMRFENPQTDVAFTVGEPTGGGALTFEVTWFSSFGGVIDSQTFETAGGVNRLVHITGTDIRTINVRQTVGLFEGIDDLVFDRDTTPPIVDIETPTFDACICGDALVSVTGSSFDPDGTYEIDTLSVRAVNAEPDDPWVFAGSASAGCEDCTLYVWGTAGVAEGRYYLRVVAENGCGLTESDVSVVRIDRSFGSAVISAPADKEEVCGVIDIDGSISDGCGIEGWLLKAVPRDGGESVLVASGTSAVSCTIAEWDTTTVPDGAYTLQLSATDTCGYTGEHEVFVNVNNRDGACLCGPDVNGDGVIDFADILAILANWT